MQGSKSLILMVLLLAVASPTLVATPLELNGGGAATTGFGPINGRAIGLQADENFALTSIGFFGDLLSESFDAVLHSSTNGSDTTGVLASNSALFGGAGLVWNDIALGFNLIAGSFYVVHFRPSDGGFSDWLGAGGYEFFPDFTLPTDVGPVTVLDGAHGFSSLDFGNFVHARMRLNGPETTVPEPGTIALLGMALAGLRFRSKKVR